MFFQNAIKSFDSEKFSFFNLLVFIIFGGCSKCNGKAGIFLKIFENLFSKENFNESKYVIKSNILTIEDLIDVAIVFFKIHSILFCAISNRVEGVLPYPHDTTHDSGSTSTCILVKSLNGDQLIPKKVSHRTHL